MCSIFVALSDGVENNDAFKHIVGDSNNETWTSLLQNLMFFDNSIEDHILYMRQRFVLGATDWMAGKNGSLQNDRYLTSAPPQSNICHYHKTSA